MSHELASEWVHVKYAETAQFTEVYGFSGSQGVVNLEGVRFVPRDKPSKTLAVYMHPSSTLQLLPMPQAMARAGVHVLCAGSRFARNDTPLIVEKVVLDLGAYIRHARDVWGYEKVVLCGWSGGGALALFYQAQARAPTVTQTPAGDPIDLAAAKLAPADAMIFQAAHLSRARMLAEWIDPSVVDEADPDRRELELDIYHPACPNRPPYSAAFIERFRSAQLERMRRRTAWVKESLANLKRQGGDELERGFVTYRTMADLRFLDPAIDPNDRKPGTCYLGKPETANTGPVGTRPLLDLARLALAMVARGLERRRPARRAVDHGAVPGDRELGRRRGAAAARAHHLRRRGEPRQDHAGHQGRDPLLPGPARAASAGGRRLPRLDGQAASARLTARRRR